jgi:hypothetical protein
VLRQPWVGRRQDAKPPRHLTEHWRVCALRRPTMVGSGGGLEPIETASQDELRALQLRRPRWTPSHAYRNVPLYRAKFDEACIRPRTAAPWRICGNIH